jgi:sulfofructose kinase
VANFVIQGGGEAASAAATLASLGIGTRFVGKVGDDARGESIGQTLSQLGIETELMVKEPGAVSPFSTIMHESSTGRRQTYWSNGSRSPVSSEEVRGEWLEGISWVYIDGTEPVAQLELARRAREQGIAVVFDAGDFSEETAAIVPHVTHILASERFASEFSGIGQIEGCLGALIEAGPSTAIITMGAEGSVGQDGENIVYQAPMSAAKIADVAGAGDIYRGAWLAATIKGRNFSESLEYATAAATLSLAHIGERAGLPRPDQIEAIIVSQHEGRE